MGCGPPLPNENAVKPMEWNVWFGLLITGWFPHTWFRFETPSCDRTVHTTWGSVGTHDPDHVALL